MTQETFPTGNPAQWWDKQSVKQDGKSYWVTVNTYYNVGREITIEEQKAQRDWQRRAPEHVINELTKGFQNQWPTIHDKVEVNDGVKHETFRNWASWSSTIWKQVDEDRKGLARNQTAAINSSSGQ
ncbi:hypothetical protein BGAL_0284g00110 [Botrytis galanthina]|uniref:Uncharacterized protein n=1 Tax=Botrytis galanthina TaxID=278940 RepID=A0A4S8QRQ0_9HELO|nr:hypothetical protein BGAL_0284g00110 [Botrytis galanthina]